MNRLVKSPHNPDLIPSMQTEPGYLPIFQTTRGGTVECVYHGAVAVIDPQGQLIAHHGNPATVTFLRSSAKPFQALPLLEMGGWDKFQLTPQELALICSSHSGTKEHLQVLHTLQQKIGLSETDLKCGTHPPLHVPSQRMLRDSGQAPSPNHHNCSGKHTGMLAQAVLLHADMESYLEPDHPVQQQIRGTVLEICTLEASQLKLGTDGCSVPTFAMPLKNAALGWARLVDPAEFTSPRRSSCGQITSAMTDHPYYVAGPGRLDTLLMEITDGKITSKGGAEAFQALGIRPGVRNDHASALGIALKISDGDKGKQVKDAVVIEVLRQLNLLDDDQLEALHEFGPEYPVFNQRSLEVGRGRPCFKLTVS